MIQRIQTVYLFIVGVLGIITLFIPLFNIDTPDKCYNITISNILWGLPWTINVFWRFGVIIAAVLIPVLAIISVFLFKKRKKQIKFSISVLIIIVVFYLCGSLFIINTYNTLIDTFNKNTNGYITISIVFGLHIISSVLIVLAIRAIKKDENLVRSLDRIRS